MQAVAIRQLTTAEQLLSHGIPVSNEELGQLAEDIAAENAGHKERGSTLRRVLRRERKDDRLKEVRGYVPTDNAPVVRGSDGYALLPQLRRVLGLG